MTGKESEIWIRVESVVAKILHIRVQKQKIKSECEGPPVFLGWDGFLHMNKKEWPSRLSPKWAVFVLAHELLHSVFNHHLIGFLISGDPALCKAFQIVADIQINRTLLSVLGYAPAESIDDRTHALFSTVGYDDVIAEACKLRKKMTLKDLEAFNSTTGVLDTKSLDARKKIKEDHPR